MCIGDHCQWYHDHDDGCADLCNSTNPDWTGGTPWWSDDGSSLLTDDDYGGLGSDYYYYGSSSSSSSTGTADDDDGLGVDDDLASTGHRRRLGNLNFDSNLNPAGGMVYQPQAELSAY
ncbi:MAG: hypothetical protein ACK559_23160, partial [bacterium]